MLNLSPVSALGESDTQVVQSVLELYFPFVKTMCSMRMNDPWEVQLDEILA